VKKRLITLATAALVFLMTPLATIALEIGGDDPIRPHPTSTIVIAEVEEGC